MKRVRVGVIGAGGLAFQIHLPNLCELKEVELCAVCDWIESRAQEACQRFGIPRAYLSHHEMLEKENLDAVFVLTQPDMLFRPAMDCLRAGLHVFMEKPMGITLFQANTLSRLAKEKNRCLWVGFNRRTIPMVVKMVERMNELTQITHIEGRFYKNSTASFYDGCASALVCDVIHVIDLIRHLSGGKAEKAMTWQGKPDADGVIQSWYSVIDFDNGVTGALRANYKTGGRVHDFELHGPGASAFIDLGFGEAGCSGKIIYSDPTQSLASAGKSSRGVEVFDGVEIAGSESYAHYYGYFEEDRQFIERVAKYPDQGDFARTQEDCETMKLVQMLVDSARKDRPYMPDHEIE